MKVGAGETRPLIKMSTLWFTSDQHFGHGNIIKYCNRPFSSVAEMDEILIQNHNKLVKPEDHVIFLGDFGFYGRGHDAKEMIKDRIKSLNGYKFIFEGNHDPDFSSLLSSGCKVICLIKQNSIYELTRTLKKPAPVLCHYPMISWNRSFHGSFHLHGHTHGTVPFDPKIRRLDVGVDVHSYSPISWEEIEAKLLAVPTPKELAGE